VRYLRLNQRAGRCANTVIPALTERLVSAMRNVNDATIMRLEREHPAWHVWIIYHAVGGPVWGARRWTDPDAANTINAGTAAALAAAIEQEKERRQR
jgi:hypothetical protein